MSSTESSSDGAHQRPPSTDNPDEVQASSPAAARNPVDVRSLALSGIFFLMVLYTLDFAAPIMIPITLAFMLSLLLSPIVGWLARIHVPQWLGAGAVLASVLGFTVVALYLLADPAAEWANRAPHDLQELESKLRKLREPIEDVRKATEQVEKLTQLHESEVAVAVGRKSFLAILFEGTPRMLAGLIVIVVLLYFLLASGDSFLRKLVTVLPRLRDKKRAVEIVRNIQSDVSIYLFTITVINLVLGLCTAGAMYLLELPNPVLWGAMVAVFNFAPYIGALFSVAILTLVAFITFDAMGQAIMVPITFLGLTIMEGQVITPTILGNRLALSPVIVFVGILFWGWFWGILGALIAVPVLVSIKIVCANVERLQPIAEFMGR